MSDIYVSRIDISNFRTFGPNFSLSIPAGPGLTIVYGMNGLGKTTFFEAIEWLLTGNVRRISSLMPSRSQLNMHLTRHAAEPNSHFVAATFGPDSTRISRSVSEQPSTDELNQLLVSPGWKPRPDDISTYLRLTMFLPQARRFRFEEENPKDQWQLLRGPAGVDQLDVMRRALGGLPTKNAFDRVVTGLEAQRVSQQRELDEWQNLLNRRMQLANRVSDARTLTPEQAESFLAALPDRLASAGFAINLPAPQETEGWTPERKLSAAVQSLDQTNDKIESELQKLRGFSELIAEWITVGNAIENDTKGISATEKQIEERKTNVAAAQKNVEQSREAVAVAERQLAQLRETRVLTVKASESLARMERSRSDLERLNEELSTTQQSAEKVRLEISKATIADQEHKSLAETVARLVAENGKLNALGARVATFDAASSESNKALVDLKTLQDEENDVTKRKEEIESRIEQCRSDEKRLEQQKSEALADAKAMTRAIKIVCDHIAEDASRCPVCRSEYKDGELKKRAEQSVAETGVDTQEIDQLLYQNKQTLDEHQEQLRAIEKRINDLPPAINQLRRQVNAKSEEASAIDREFVTLGYDLSTAREQLRAAMEAALQRIGEMREKLSNLPSPEESHRQLEAFEAIRLQLEEKGQTTEDTIRARERQVEQDEAIVTAFREQTGKSDLNSDAIARMVAESRTNEATSIEKVDAVKRDYEKAKSDQEQLATELQRIRTTLDTQNSTLAASQQRLETLSQRWQQILDGTPDATSQQREISAKENGVEAIVSLRRECSLIAERLDAWRASNESSELVSSIAEKLRTHDGSTEDELTSKLESDISATEAEVSRVKEVKARATKLATDLQERVDEFNDRALKPLAKRIQRFHDVLSPFRYQIGWEARTVRNAMELRQTVSNESGLNSQVALPQVELSDGQMAVQGLSTLFAASTEYRWSRWPALLLDDPLQSSDLLHTSAFIDILRGLIVELGYQVFISSHDMEEAKYIIRKCERSGINVTKCHLLGPRSNGVRVTSS